MKRLVRWAILIPGVLYLWALLPIVSAQYTGSPLRKPDTTVNVDVVGAPRDFSTQGVVDAASIGLQKLSSSRIKRACEAPALLKPIVRPAQHVTVRYVNNGRIVAETHYDCNKYA